MARKTAQFIAKFSNGVVLARTSHHAYTHAWLLTLDGAVIEHGFSSTAALAQTAANSYANGASGLADAIRYTNKPRGKFARYATVEYYRYAAGLVRKHGGAESWVAKATAERARYVVEVARVEGGAA